MVAEGLACGSRKAVLQLISQIVTLYVTIAGGSEYIGNVLWKSGVELAAGDFRADSESVITAVLKEVIVETVILMATFPPPHSK